MSKMEWILAYFDGDELEGDPRYKDEYEKYQAVGFTQYLLYLYSKYKPLGVVYLSGQDRRNKPLYQITLGHFQDIDTEIDYEACKRKGVIVFRRVGVGGGTIIVGPWTMGHIFLCDWSREENKKLFPDMDTAFGKVGQLIVRKYQYLGVKNAWYKHIGDVRVGLGNRKIAGFGFTTVANFLAMNQIIGIGKPDLDYFIDVLRIPEEKIKDKPYKTIEEYLYAGMTSVEQEIGRKPSNDEVKEALIRAYDEVLGVKLVEHEFGAEDRNFWLDLYEKMEREVGDKQLYMISSSRRFSSIPEDCMLGFARHKARKLIVAHVLVNREGIIKDVMLSGDFYCKPFEYAGKIEENLKGVSVNDKDTILKKVKEICDLKEWEAPLVEAEDFVEAVFNAGLDAYKKLTGK